MDKTSNVRNDRRRRLWHAVKQYKLERGCSLCGYNKVAEALQFDHIADNKRGNVSDLIRSDYGIHTVWQEIKKCQLLCANCHAEQTQLRKAY